MPLPSRPGLVRSSGLLGAATALARLSNVGVLALLSRSSGPEAVGYYGLATLAGSLVALGFSLGFPTYATRGYAAGDLTSQDVARIHWVRLAGLVLGAVLLSVITPLILDPAVQVPFVFFAIAIMFDQWNETAWSTIRATESALAEPTTNFVGNAVGFSAVAILFVADELNAFSASVTLLVTAALRSTVAVVSTGLWLKKTRTYTSTLSSQARAALPYLASDVLGLAYLRGDVAILALFVGATSVGHYVSAGSLTAPVVQVAASMSLGALAFASRPQTGGPDATKAESDSFRSVERFFLSTGAGVCALLFLVFPFVVPVLFGIGDSFEVLDLAFVLLLFLPMRFVNFGLSSILLARGRAKTRFAVLCVGVVCNCMANLALMPLYGASAAAWTTVGTELVITALFLAAGGAKMSSSRTHIYVLWGVLIMSYIGTRLTEDVRLDGLLAFLLLALFAAMVVVTPMNRRMRQPQADWAQR